MSIEDFCQHLLTIPEWIASHQESYEGDVMLHMANYHPFALTKNEVEHVTQYLARSRPQRSHCSLICPVVGADSLKLKY